MSGRGQGVADQGVADAGGWQTSRRRQQPLRDGAWRGCVAAHWRIPSDHLPVGCVLEGGPDCALAGLRVVSWNVLNTRFDQSNLDGQGLRHSRPWRLYRPTRACVAMGDNLSERDALVLRTLEVWLGLGRIVASETEVPILLVNLV